MRHFDCRSEKLLQIVKEGGVIRGSHAFFGEPMVTEAIALSGVDAVWIDMEHTPIDKNSLPANLMAVRSGGAAAFVRIPWNDPVLAKPVLEMGIDGMIFPYIRSVDEAKRAIEACEYPPKGIRGYGPMRGLEYGNIAQTDYVDTRYRETLRIVQVEHIDCVNCLEEMVKLDGIDGFLVGPNDLSGSCGHIGRVDHPDMMPVYDKVASIMRGSGKIFGVSMGYRPAVLKQWLDRGCNLLFAGADVDYIHTMANSVSDGLTELVNERNSK